MVYFMYRNGKFDCLFNVVYLHVISLIRLCWAEDPAYDDTMVYQLL